MNFKRLVFLNVLRNGRDYASYFLSSLFSVMVFFIFSLIYFHPAIKDGVKASSTTLSFLGSIGLTLAQVLIVFMSFIFLWYTFTVFLKSRKRDFSIYLILGMSDRDLKKMILLENSILGGSSIMSGIVVGTLFSKFILLVSQNILAIEDGLTFYFPFKPILLTSSIFLVIFLVISFVTTQKIGKDSLSELTKGNEKPLPEPKASWLKSGIAILSIVLGYLIALMFYFFFRGEALFTIGSLGLCVFLTVLGTFLLFHQTSIRIFSWFKRRNWYFNNTNMLSISNLVYRMKSNATMYFMICIAATVAFVGIGITKAIGGSDFSETQASSFAYTYIGYYDVTTKSATAQETNVTFIEDTIKEAGYKPITINLRPLPTQIITEDSGEEGVWISAIPLSEYNRLLKFNNEKELKMNNGNELILLASSNASVNEVKTNKELSGKKEGTLIIQDTDKMAVSYEFSDRQFSVDSYGNIFAVVPDLFSKMIATRIEEDFEEGDTIENTYAPISIIHYHEWVKGGDIDKKIRTVFNAQEKVVEKKVDDYLKEIGKASQNDLTDEQYSEISEIEAGRFSFSSLFNTWTLTRQTNGMTLMISVLIGSVFFTFTACIIYFRLFGELDRDGAYHRSIHILGVSRKDRHKIVTREMLIMYFAPIFIAICHFVVAMIALKLLIDLPVFTYIGQILLVYLVFQIIFFFVSRWRYLIHLDMRAERN